MKGNVRFSPLTLPLSPEGRGGSEGGFDIWNLLQKLTLSRRFYLETGNELFEFFPATFWAFRLSGIVLTHAEDHSKFLFAFRASIVVGRHPLSLLSPENRLTLI